MESGSLPSFSMSASCSLRVERIARPTTSSQNTKPTALSVDTPLRRRKQATALKRQRKRDSTVPKTSPTIPTKLDTTEFALSDTARQLQMAAREQALKRVVVNHNLPSVASTPAKAFNTERTTVDESDAISLGSLTWWTKMLGDHYEFVKATQRWELKDTPGTPTFHSQSFPMPSSGDEALSPRSRKALKELEELGDEVDAFDGESTEAVEERSIKSACKHQSVTNATGKADVESDVKTDPKTDNLEEDFDPQEETLDVQNDLESDFPKPPVQFAVDRLPLEATCIHHQHGHVCFHGKTPKFVRASDEDVCHKNTESVMSQEDDEGQVLEVEKDVAEPAIHAESPSNSEKPRISQGAAANSLFGASTIQECESRMAKADHVLDLFAAIEYNEELLSGGKAVVKDDEAEDADEDDSTSDEEASADTDEDDSTSDEEAWADAKEHHGKQQEVDSAFGCASREGSCESGLVKAVERKEMGQPRGKEGRDEFGHVQMGDVESEGGGPEGDWEVV